MADPQGIRMEDAIEGKLLERGVTLSSTINGGYKTYKCVVPLSGGKDSQACLVLALQRFQPSEILALFCDTQFEHPWTYEHINNVVIETGVDLVTLNAGSVLSVCTKYKRFPGGGARHCTDELKIRPSKFFYKALAEQQGGFEIWYGMRSDESPEREKRYRGKVSEELYPPHEVMPRKYPKYLDKLGVSMKLPVLEYSTSEIFDLLAGSQNPLYFFGRSRVGCFPCLAGGEEDQVAAFNFDETGRKHYKIAEQISEVAGRPILTTKKYGGGCAICSI